jgi:hypothetical protein
MIIYPEIAGVLIEYIQVADEITLVGGSTSKTTSCPSCGTPLREYKVAIDASSMTFHLVGVLPI